MPRHPIIPSDTRRAVAIAVVMACVLAASMAVAIAMSATGPRTPRTTVNLARLSVQVPDGWRRLPPGQVVPGVHPQAVLQDPDHPGRTLFIGGMVLRASQSAVAVLSVMVTQLTPPAAQAALQGQPVQTFSKGGLQGAGIVALGETDGQLQHHQMAVVTRDGRQHWVLYLASAYEADENPIVTAQDKHLFDGILKSVQLSDAETN